MDSSDFNEHSCVICLNEFSSCTEEATVVTKGISTLIEYSKLRCDVSLQAYLERQNENNPNGRVLVHAKCRRAYIDPKRAKHLLLQYLQRPQRNRSCVLTNERSNGKVIAFSATKKSASTANTPIDKQAVVMTETPLLSSLIMLTTTLQLWMAMAHFTEWV